MENSSVMTVKEDKSRSIQFFHQHLLQKEQKCLLSVEPLMENFILLIRLPASFNIRQVPKFILEESHEVSPTPDIFFPFLKLINFNWRTITLSYCDGFCHTSTWISHGYTLWSFKAMLQGEIKRSLQTSNNMRRRLLLSLLSHVWHCTTYRLQPVRLPGPWDSLGKSTRVGGHVLLQGVFPTQGSNPGLLHCWQILYHWATKEAL